MNRLKFPVFLLCSLISFSCLSPSSDYGEIAEELLEDMEEAYNDGNLRKVAQFYADEAKLLAPGGYIVEGRQAVDDYWMKLKPIEWNLISYATSRHEKDLYQSDYWKKMTNKPPHWKEHNIQIGPDEEVIYQLGHSELSYFGNDGNEVTSNVDFILVWKKMENGEYKAYIDTYVGS